MFGEFHRCSSLESSYNLNLNCEIEVIWGVMIDTAYTFVM